MALHDPLMPSSNVPGNLSAFSPYSESPSSPARFRHFTPAGNAQSNRSSSGAESLAPPQSPYPQQIEPSPVDSNGTEGTEIDDDAQENADGESSDLAIQGKHLQTRDIEITSPASAKSENPPRIDTQIPLHQQFDSPDNDPQSVIHVPAGFKGFDDSPQSDSSPARASESTARLASPRTPEAVVLSPTGKKHISSKSTVGTDAASSEDRSAPQSESQEGLEEEDLKQKRRDPSSEDAAESIDQSAEKNSGIFVDGADGPETTGLVNQGSMQETIDKLDQVNEEVQALRTALNECWTLCNTLANLSSSHRQRTFKYQGKTEVQEQAWRSCWRLCQQLYESKDEDHTAQVIPTLELCREFCQALFDARRRIDEASDSVLRVSFELNNHLYHIHDRNLPDAFIERTLDFYITICHRLMKTPTRLPRETDALLRACWSLAEMLFNLRQNSRDGKQADEELLGSAVQSCWELCDLFREGWTQIRPDRATPRPSQTTFGSQSQTSLKSGSTRGSAGQSTSSTISNRNYHEAQSFPPETPVTIFEDASTANSSPDSVSVPNILVLGPASSGGSARAAAHHDRWTSDASVMSNSGSATSSQRTSSTTTTGGEETHLLRIRCLLLKAGINTGYSRTSGQTLPSYVKTLRDDAFGTLPWQMKVLSFYKKLVTNDKSMLTVLTMPSRGLSAAEVGKSVRWLGNNENWAWMRDLFRLVFGFGVDEIDRRGGSFHT